MSGSEFHGIEDAAVVPDFNGGIGPPVETVTSVAAVIECRLLLQVSAARIQRELHAPLHAVDAIDIADPYRGASVAFSLHREVYGRNRHPIVRNGKVELDAEGGPHSAVCNSPILDAGVGIKYRSPVDLVDTRIDVPSQVRQNNAFQIFVL